MDNNKTLVPLICNSNDCRSVRRQIPTWAYELNEANCWQIDCEVCGTPLDIDASSCPDVPAGALRLGDVCELLPNNDLPFNTCTVIKIVITKHGKETTLVRPYVHTSDVASVAGNADKGETGAQIIPYIGMETFTNVDTKRLYRLYSRQEVK